MTMLAQHRKLLPDQGVVAVADVAAVGVLRYQLERHFLAAAADPEGRFAAGLIDRGVDAVVLSGEDRAVLGPHTVDDFHRLAESAHSLRHLGPFVAVGAPFVLVPAGAEAGV